MPLDILHSPATGSARLTVAVPRYAPLVSFALLTAACALASFAFACATPFAAFAVVAAAILPLPSALLVIVGAWLVNQGIGFGFLHYPVDANTIVWGVVIGIAAFIATAASALILRLLSRTASPVALGPALIAAYAAYELVLFAATPFLGGAGDFTVAIVGRLGILNVLWLIGLVAACEVLRLLSAVRRRHMTS